MKMLKNLCVCKKNSLFIPVIEYSKGIFPQYHGLVIGRCINCGILKTIAQHDSINQLTSQAEYYEENKEKFRAVFMPIVKELQKYKKTGTVLDIGCSSGILIELLFEYGYRVEGIEPNKNAYSLAKKRFNAQVFNKTSQQFYKKCKKKYDIIIYNHVLEHIPDVDREFLCIKKFLKKNGLLIIGVPNTDNIIFKIRGERWESLMPKDHIWHFNTKNLIHVLASRGFIINNITYSNHQREDYPLIKRIYFRFLVVINILSRTGEAMLVIATHQS